jgi:hypothetical protein
MKRMAIETRMTDAFGQALTDRGITIGATPNPTLYPRAGCYLRKKTLAFFSLASFTEAIK